MPTGTRETQNCNKPLLSYNDARRLFTPLAPPPSLKAGRWKTTCLPRDKQRGFLYLQPIMSNDTNRFQAIISHCKEYGFIFPSSEIYDGLSAVYDYGQYGSELKKNIKDHWWKSMTQLQENIVGIDAAIFMHPTVWKASGHVDNFSDPMIDNKDSKKRYRVDHLIEGFAEALPKEQGDALLAEMEQLLAANDFAGLKKLIEDNKIK